MLRKHDEVTVILLIFQQDLGFAVAVQIHCSKMLRQWMNANRRARKLALLSGKRSIASKQDRQRGEPSQQT